MRCLVHAPGVHEYILGPSEFAPLANLVKDVEVCGGWRDSVTMSSSKGYRTSNSFHITQMARTHALMAEYDKILYTVFNKALQEYQTSFELKVETDEGYELLRYTDGQQYKKHVDQGGHQYGRIVSGLLYINNDFTGGELELLHYNVKIKPSAPSVLLFPSNYVYEHVAHPVTVGAKYAVVTFFHPLDEIVEQKKRQEKMQVNRPSLYGATNL